MDPNIILGIRSPQIQQADPLEQYGKSLALKGLIGQQDLQGVQLQNAQQANADDMAVRSAYQQSGGDNARLRQLLQSGGQYKAVREFDKNDLDTRAKQAGIDKDKASAAESDYKTQIGQIQHGSSILQFAMENPAAWPSARRAFIATFPKAAGELPEEFDPNFVQSKIASGQTITERLKAQHDAGVAKETNRHNTTVEAETGRNNVASNAATIRGQNMTAATAKRGQDLTESRAGQHYDADRGVVVDMRGGTARPVTENGKPLGVKDKALTESQGNATGFGLRATRSNDIIAQLEKDGTFGRMGALAEDASKIPVIGGIPSGIIGQMTTESQQKYVQAKNDFKRAVLRKESGATISPSEDRDADRQYFPQAGDSKAVIEQKARNRATAIESLKIQAGPGAKSITGAPPPPPPAGGIKFLGFEG